MPTVYVREIEDGYQLMRNGKPFHITGAAGDPAYLEELKEAGGNSLRIYDTVGLTKTLDKAEDLGLTVTVDIPLPRYDRFPEYYEEDSLFLPIKEKVKEIVSRHKDHPALLYWNLGNEIHYPGFYRDLNFFPNYHGLIDLIHEIDGNHPISTPIAAGHRNIVTSIALRNPNLNFTSINIFGGITSLHERPEFNKFIWKGPYVISEWGNNGPWERERVTRWGASIEESSTIKAEVIRERYFSPAQTNNSSLGNFVFYWGRKVEGTHTWFSLFGENGMKTQAVFELENIWKDRSLKYEGPEVQYLTLNGKRSFKNVILSPGASFEVEVISEKPQEVEYRWEIRYESWSDIFKSELAENREFRSKDKRSSFTAPMEEGPYRIFVYLTNGSEYFATANFPFYVLAPGDAN